MTLTYRFTLSDDEFARAWLREYYRRPGWRVFRVAFGPAVAILGVAMVRGDALFNRAMGIAAILLGAWYALKPFLAARMIRNARHKSGRSDLAIELRLSDRGVRIDDGHKRTDLAWEDVTAAGRGPDYVWYEIGRGARATIPLRAVDDLDALEALLREKTAWAG